MFKKKEDNENRYKRLSRVEQSFITGDIVIEGKIHSEKPFVICGKFFGEITSTSRIEIEVGAEVQGTIRAKEVIVRGVLIGDVECYSLQVLSGATFRGKTRTCILFVEPKAEFEASSQMILKEKFQQKNIIEEKAVQAKDEILSIEEKKVEVSDEEFEIENNILITERGEVEK
ncbi:MAG: polymer-forming cytoskeletal protein [Campylobacteraceae bacterium]